MRLEDMAIACKDSTKYFDLNKNVGLVEQEKSEASATERIIQKPALKTPFFKPAFESNTISNKKTTETKKDYQQKPLDNELQDTAQNLSIKDSGKVAPSDMTKNILKSENLRNEFHDFSKLNDFSTFQKSSERDAQEFIQDGTDISQQAQQIRDFHPSKTNEVPLIQNSLSDQLGSSISIDDVIDLVKDSLEKSKPSAIEENTDQIIQIYQSNEGVKNNDSKIIVIAKTYEGVEPVFKNTSSKLTSLKIQKP